MTTPVTFKSKKGSEVSGVLAEPAGSGKAPAVVLLQEWWGINAHIEDLCDRLAKEGFVVLAPDLYHGKIAKDATEASALMTALDTLSAVGEIAGAAGHLKEHPRGNGKVGVMGFCMGGALSFAAACHVEGLGAVVAVLRQPPPGEVGTAPGTRPGPTPCGPE
jgi:carboxymethylenebutenolidase